MPLTDAGALAISKLLMGDAQTIFNLANTRIGVGGSNTAFAKTQTDLQATTDKFRKAVDSPFPTRTGSTIRYQATYATAEGNFPATGWQEWAVFNGVNPTDTMLNRKVESLGTKNNTQSWQFTVDLAIQA